MRKSRAASSTLLACKLSFLSLARLLTGSLFRPHLTSLTRLSAHSALPTLDIAEGALNRLIDLYKEVLPSLGGYLTYAGQLDRWAYFESGRWSN